MNASQGPTRPMCGGLPPNAAGLALASWVGVTTRVETFQPSLRPQRS